MWTLQQRIIIRIFAGPTSRKAVFGDDESYTRVGVAVRYLNTSWMQKFSGLPSSQSLCSLFKPVYSLHDSQFIRVTFMSLVIDARFTWFPALRYSKDFLGGINYLARKDFHRFLPLSKNIFLWTPQPTLNTTNSNPTTSPTLKQKIKCIRH